MLQDASWVRVALAVMIHLNVLMISAWDLLALASGRSEFTVSRLVQDWAVNNPVLPLMVGVAIGHIFWPVG